MFKKIVQMKLKFFAKLILAKYQPKIVGITGSVGKTSTKEAVYTVLSGVFRTRRSLKNYNNEFGVPLTIIGASSAGKNFFLWMIIFWKAFWLLIIKDKNYPEILVLEMGVDKPGDMKYLLNIARPDVSIVTMIGPTHLESFKEIANIRKEKAELVKGLKRGGLAILNADNDECLKIKTDSQSRVVTYGFSKGADIKASNLNFKYKDLKSLEGILGLTFKLDYQGSILPVTLPRVIGRPVVYAALAAATVGLYFKMNLVDIASSLEGLDSAKGRLRIIDGIKKSFIIDDTYNASPQSSLAAIDFISNIKVDDKFRKIAVFGDMLELGSLSEESHREVGRALCKAGFEMIIAVGERARDIVRGALKAGMKDSQLFQFAKNEEAGKFLQNKMKKGDLILIKGSQGARMEEVVKEVMADPLNADKLLVRQDKEWQ